MEKDDASAVLGEISGYFSERSIETLVYTFDREILSEELDSVDLAITLGGDGTLLYASSFLSHRGIPLLAVNLGHVGFITEISRDEWVDAYEKYHCCSLGVSERIMVQVTVSRQGGEVFSASGLNDAVIGTHESRVSSICVSSWTTATQDATALTVSLSPHPPAPPLTRWGPAVRSSTRK